MNLNKEDLAMFKKAVDMYDEDDYVKVGKWIVRWGSIIYEEKLRLCGVQ